jgi:phage gpG-like protein
VASTKGTEVVVQPTLKELRKRLAAKRKAVADLRTPLARAAVLLDQWVQHNFKTEGGKVGGWTPFAKNAAGVPIVELRDPERAPAKLLRRKGRLRSSFAPFTTKDTAGIGSELPYSMAHHEGLGLPERRLLPDKGAAKREVLRAAREIMADHVAKGSRK